MNQDLQEFARKKILDGLSRLPSNHVQLFRRMYSDDLQLDIEKVVADMDEEKLDWAMQQIERSLEKLNSKKGK